MIVGKAIYHLLTNATAITDIVGTRIYPEVAQQDGDLPYIVYNITNNEPSDTKPEPSKLDTAEIEVHCYATSYSQAIDIAVAVRGALDRVKGTYNGVNVQSIQYINEVIDFDEPQRAYEVTADYEVRISRTDFEIAQGSPITGVELGQLSDVNVTGVTDNQILSYDAASDTWVPAADAGGVEVLNDLTDVDASQPVDNQMLAYQQGEWTTIYQDEIVLPIASVTGLQAELNTIPDGLDDLDDVKIVGTPAEGDALVYQSGFWSRGTAGASTLGDLDDVNTTGAGVGSTIVYNGSTWEISGSELPSDDIYYHNRYLTEAGTLRTGATETVELYYTAQADGDGLSESASSDTPSAGNVIRRKLWYAEKAQADPDTTADWTQFADIADDTAYATAKATLLAYLKARTGGTVPISLKMTWEDVAAINYLLDDYSGAAAAYSLRLLSSTYSGDAVEVYNGSSYADIGFDSNGELDTTALAAHCGSNDGFVSKWYCQSGNSNDAAQGVTANMPKIYDGTTGVVTENGKPAVEFDGSDDQLTHNISGLVSGNFTYSDVFTSSDGAAILHSSTSTNTKWIMIAQTSTQTQLSDGFLTAYDNYFKNGTSALSVGATRTDLKNAFYNGNQNLAFYHGTTSSVSVSQMYLGRYQSSGFHFSGKLQESILWTSDQQTAGNRTNIEDNINTFYSIF